MLAVIAGLLLPAILVTGYSWLKRYDEDVHKRTRELLQQHAEVLASSMQEALWNVDRESGNTLVDSMMRNEDIVMIEVRDNNLGLFVKRDIPARRQGLSLSLERKVQYRKTDIGWLRLEVSSSRQRQIIQENLREYLIALAAQVTLALILILVLLDQRLVRPLRRLAKNAETLASGQLDASFTWKRLDEIGHLGQQLEHTRIALQNLFGVLEQKNAQLEDDLEKRKQVELELREREARIRALVEQSPIAIIEWDMDFCVVEWNAAAERIFGHTRQQALGRHASFIVPKASRAAGDTIFQEASTSTNVVSGVNQNLRADGKIIYCLWNNSHIANASGRTGRLLSMAQDITEQRRAEEARHWSEAKFAGAFQCYPDPVAILRLHDGLLLDMNQAFVKVCGLERAELLERDPRSLGLWPASQQSALVEKVQTYSGVHDLPWELQTATGEKRSCLLNATLFHVGAEAFLLAVIRDVTVQLRFEAQKAEADRALLRLAQGTQGAGAQFFQSLLEDLAAALGVAYAELRLLDDSGAVLHSMARHGLEEAPASHDWRGAPAQEVLQRGLCVYADQVQALFPDDASLCALQVKSYAGAPLKNAQGQVIGLLAISHTAALHHAALVRSLLPVFAERAAAEIERMRSEEALRERERSFSTIFHSSPVAMSVIAVNNGFFIRDINGAFEKLLGLAREHTVSHEILALPIFSTPADRQALEAMLQAQDSEPQHEIWLQRASGEAIFVQISQNSFSLNNDQYVTVAFEDITENFNNELAIHDLNVNLEHRVVERTDELQRANRELASTLETLSRAQEDLVRSEKLAALGSLVAGIAHELNTPIGNSLMVASTLVDQTRDFRSASAQGLKRSILEAYVQDASKAGDILVRNLHRAADLVTSFKQVAIDQTSSKRRPFVLSEVVGEILLTLYPAIKKTAYVVEQEFEDNLAMDSYPGPLGQVLTNLINNALIHGFDGRENGKIVIRGRALPEDWIELSLTDDGVGIPQENLKRIYDPFFTTKLGAGGSGLGLNITHNIVTGLLGGKIAVHSEVGVGTVFTLSLPCNAPHSQHDEKPLHPEDVARARAAHAAAVESSNPAEAE
ncbi:PAS domain S-box protein [Massilia sp. W12]|uniref:PAS domain S-box protein n=1 Tax=Massilia sp. W12 TaxID=3126507 RepID=UPI0030D20237